MSCSVFVSACVHCVKYSFCSVLESYSRRHVHSRSKLEIFESKWDPLSRASLYTPSRCCLKNSFSLWNSLQRCPFVINKQACQVCYSIYSIFSFFFFSLNFPFPKQFGLVSAFVWFSRCSQGGNLTEKPGHHSRSC